MRNFFSVGQVTQVVDLNTDNLTLVLGANMDISDEPDDARNGVGKTVLANAISYGLYGVSLSNVKKSNLINKTNKKQMLVTLSFQKDNTTYRIERGRTPTYLKFYIDDVEQEITDESQGDSRQTQQHIESLLGMSHDLFKLLVVLNTYSKPFLSMSAAEQRTVIEQLLGVTILSEKADALKSQIKTIKEQVQTESARIQALESSNKRIQLTITSLKNKRTEWNQSVQSEIALTQQSLAELEHLDTDTELKNHEIAAEYNQITAQRDILITERKNTQYKLNSDAKIIEKLNSELEKLENNTCFTCGQPVHDEKMQEIRANLVKTMDSTTESMQNHQNHIDELNSALNELGEPASPPSTFYKNIKDVYNHQNNVALLQDSLNKKQTETDPYTDQITELENTALSEIDWTPVNELDSYREHQEFLLKLLTNKDSFIRKKIIDQNLAYLNSRLTYYLEHLGLPHLVKFQNDLSVEITMLGQDLDFDNLSRGERTRLTLGLSFAFRDVWEHLKHEINLLFIDELLDSGLDGAGIENALGVLKHIGRNRKKNIFLISHREGLIGRVNNTLMVIKENGFTRFEMSDAETEHGRI